MVERSDTAKVELWGHDVGALYWDSERALGFFEFEPSFHGKGINLSPYLIHSDNPGIISYPELDRNTYKGIPGFLADTLPDDFGNAVINAWLVRNGRDLESFSPVERLCYTGTRGMGALEFHPATFRNTGKETALEVDQLVNLASDVLGNREKFSSDRGELVDLIRVGTSAGGQRPKALLAIHPRTGRILSGQIKAPVGYESWLMKFDGVSGNAVPGVVTDPQGFGQIEYAYYLMALDCKIEMTECKLFSENGRSHFMTKRFDRTEGGDKVHMLSLCGMAHFDYNKSGYYSYEQLFQVMRVLKLPFTQAVQMFRRVVFNIVARNQDDHTKNIVFLMNRQGHWTLSPAFDLTFSYNPHGVWTDVHQMTLNGKRNDFVKEDLVQLGKSLSIKRPHVIIEEVLEVVARFRDYGHLAGIESKRITAISDCFRLF